MRITAGARVDVEADDSHAKAEQRTQRAPSDATEAEYERLRWRCAEMGHEMPPATAVRRQDQPGAFEGTDFTCEHTIGRAELVGILGGDGDQLGFQQSVDLLAVGSRVQVSEKRMSGTQVGVFGCQYLLHLDDELCLTVDVGAVVG